MRAWTIPLVALSLWLAPLGGLQAQEVVQVNGVEATRVVIAPPQSELARIIKKGLSDAYFGADRDTRAYAQAQKLYYFYGARHFEPLWLVEDAAGQIGFSPKAKMIIGVFERAALEGFRPSDYLTPELDVEAVGTDPAKLAALETAFSSATVRYAQDAYGGRVAPTQIDRTWTVTPKVVDEAALLVRLAASETPDQLLYELSPTNREFVALRAALGKFYDGSVVDAAVTIPDGPLLKPGMADERVTMLRQRLDVPEPEILETAGAGAAPDTRYDDALVEAVTAFQDSLGLTADGVVGPATVAALNGGSATTKEDIIANMERWRWEPAEYGSFRVWVNLPEYRLYIIDNGTVDYTTRVVIGTPKNQTPVFNDMIRHVVVNPYWNVPSSILINEIGPAVAADPGYLASQNMELLSGGQVISPSSVDWSTTSIRRFAVRQRPGSNNALGQVKFLFPNQHDIYLHDTPTKSLFQRSTRAFSHGCVRVQNPFEFADALLKYEPKLTRASLESQFGPREQWNNLEIKVPVHLTYFTLRVDEDGTIRSFGDIYGANDRLKTLLGL